MRNLRKYIEGINRMRAIFKNGEQIDLNNLNNDVAQQLFQNIDCVLSPENLCCDGELSMTQVRKKARMLNGAVRELQSLGYFQRI